MLYRAGGAGSRLRKYTIGPYGRVTLHQARATALKIFAARTEGRDPAAEKQQARRRLVADRVEDLVELFVNEHVSKNRSAREISRLLRREVTTETASPKNVITGFWISRLGRPLKYGSVARVVTETVRMTLGVPVNPHLFRSAGATSAVLHAPHSPHLASALLQHSDSKVTEAHYIRASSLSVARDFAALIGDLRTP